jgi:cytoskeletal protein CcmA (bactofilin family)
MPEIVAKPPQPHSAEPPSRDAKAADAEKPTAAAEAPAGSKLIVGPRIKLRGVEITDCDTLVVEGRVEASMDSRVVQIAEGGVFTGTATMDVAEIWGCFEGELTARKRLVIHNTGHVSGIIRYGTICIEEGGRLSGEVSTTASVNAGSEIAPPAAAPMSIVPVQMKSALA